MYTLPVLALVVTQSCLAAAFTLLSQADPPAVQGTVMGSVPVEAVAGRPAARLSSQGCVTLPTAQYFDPRRGGLDLWVRPDWEPAAPERHTLFHVGENDALSHFTIFKTESPTIRFVVKHDPNTYATIDTPIADWRPGEWHRVRASWLATGERLLILLQIDEGDVRHFLGGKPLETVPELAYIGRRGPAPQFADAAIAQLTLTSEPILEGGIPRAAPGPVTVTVDAARRLGPVRRVHDCTTIWNTRDRPLPFAVGDPKWQRFKDAQFSLARLVAFSENWLWGTKVERDAGGRLQLDFTDLDGLVDMVRAAGAEPYVRLAYHMPRALSSRPDDPNWAYSPPSDPAEWDALMRAIVHHLNVERKLGVKYFVCTLNEADIAVARHGTEWQDILDLHERTVRAVKEVDPTVKVGGPAICMPLDGLGGQCLRDFVRFSRERDLPLDFICFHRYGAAHPRDLEAHVKQIQQIVHEADPDLDPEWFCDEYNLWARDRTADDEYGAAYLAAAVHYFRRAGLDKLSLVSFNDVLPEPSPPHEILSHAGPFDRTEDQVARFLARKLSAAGVERVGILAHPPTPPGDYTFGRYRVTVPADGNPRLVFSTGIAAHHERMDGVGFTIAVCPAGQDPLAAPLVFDHFQRTEAWVTHEVSLGDYAGQTVLIELRADPGRAPQAQGVADHAAWGEPRLVTGAPGQERTAFDFAERIGEATTGTADKGWQFAYNEETIARSTGLPLIKGPVVTAPYFTLLMYSKLLGEDLEVRLDGEAGILDDDCLGVSAAAEAGALRALVWSFDPLGEGERDVRLRFEGLPQPDEKARLRVWLIDRTHTNAWHDYVEAGLQPGESYNLTTGALAQVEEKETAPQGGAVEVTLRLSNLAVALVEVKPGR